LPLPLAWSGAAETAKEARRTERKTDEIVNFMFEWCEWVTSDYGVWDRLARERMDKRMKEEHSSKETEER